MLRSIKKIQLLLRAFILFICKFIYLFNISNPISNSRFRFTFVRSSKKNLFSNESSNGASLILELFVSSKSYEETYFSLTVKPISRDLIKPLQTPKRPILHKLPRNISNPRTTFYEETISHNPANIEPLDTPQTSQTSRLPTQPL